MSSQQYRYSRKGHCLLPAMRSRTKYYSQETLGTRRNKGGLLPVLHYDVSSSYDERS